MSNKRRKITLQELEDFVEDDDDNDQLNDAAYEDLDDDVVDSRSHSTRDSGVATPVDDGEMKHIVNQVVRLVLSRELTGKKIRLEHMAKYIKHNLGKKVTYNKLIEEAKSILNEVYGLTLEEVATVGSNNNQEPQQKQDQTNANSTTTSTTKTRRTVSSKGPFIVVSNLLDDSRSILGRLWSQDLNSSFKKGELGSTNFFIPQYEKSSAPGSHYELVKTGLMLVIVSVIILNENHIQESVLLRRLRKFGVSDNLNRKNSNINMNAKELLNELTEREYLSRKKLKGRDEREELLDYSLGKRSLVEFTPRGVFEYIKIIYGDNYDSTIAERALVTIERTYGVALEETINTEGGSEQPSEEPSEQPGE